MTLNLQSIIITIIPILVIIYFGWIGYNLSEINRKLTYKIQQSKGRCNKDG